MIKINGKWKGTTKENKRKSEAMKIIMNKSSIKESISKKMTGRKHNEEANIKLSRALTGRKFSEEHIKNLKKASTEKWSKVDKVKWGEKMKLILGQPEERKRNSERMKKQYRDNPQRAINWKNRVRDTLIFPKKDTKIEIKIQNYLKLLGIEFATHQYIKDIKHGYQCDILIPSRKLVIECFGVYWHDYPLSREIDIIRCKELRAAGYRVLVLWENEINVIQLEEFENELEKFKEVSSL